MEFNERLIRARKEKAMSQEALAEIIGVSRQAVSKWETGEAKPDADKLIAICRALDLSMDQLCLGKEETPAEVLCQPVKRSAWKWIVSFVAGLLIGALIMGAVTHFTRGAEDTTDYSLALQSMNAAHVTRDVEFDGDYQYWHISMVPGLNVDGMLVEFLVINNDRGTSTLLDAKYTSDGRYELDYPIRDSYDLEFIAVFTLGKASVQVPLFSIEGTESGSSIIEYWNQQG